jgi:RNA polymerase sigma-70 factor (ECF subfamily)
MHNWTELADSYGPLVWRVAWRILEDHEDAADCRQEVFMDAFRRAGQRPIQNWPAFLNWLTVRRALDRLRRRQHAGHRQRLGEAPEVADESEPGREAEWDELLDLLRVELTHIPERQAEAFWLHCVEELSLAEVAGQLDVSANHAGVLVHRARLRLRETLRKKHCDLVRHHI